MCGRFNVIDNPELQQLLKDLDIDLSIATITNVAPTETISLVRDGLSGRELTPVRWWLTPAWAPEVSTRYSMFNAKSETLDQSRAFKTPFARQRGIVPASSFIEWKSEQGHKQPYLIRGQGRALALAAIWDHWTRNGADVLSCALITTAAAPEFSDIHHRMPVMLDHAGMSTWLDGATPKEELPPLFDSRLRQDLLVSPISPEINNARNKNPDLLEDCGPVRVLSA